MADQTIVTSNDTYLDGATGFEDTQRDTLNRVKLQREAAAGGGHPVLRFDVSSLSGKVWDSVKLILTYQNSEVSGPPIGNMVRILKDVDPDDCTWNQYQDTPNENWGVAGARTSVDVDITNAVIWTFPAGAWSIDDVVTSPDITTIVEDAISNDSGILDLEIWVGTGSGPGRQWHSLESGEPPSKFPHLFFSNVQAAPSGNGNGGTGVATNVPSGSATISTKSARPPVQEPGRQAVMAILHDGVEPMTILALTIKAGYGTDA